MKRARRSFYADDSRVDRFGALFSAAGIRLHLPDWPFTSAALAALGHFPLADWFASHIRNGSKNWNFWLIFAYFIQNFAPIAANFSDSKFVASTKSYARSKKPHFHPSERRFLGPTHLTFLSGKLARSKLFG